MRVKIVKYDNFGSGIGYDEYNKLVFVPKSVIDDELIINITKDYKTYCQGEIIEIVRPSIKRVESKCPYFFKCGGCHFRTIRYEDTLLYKQDKVKDILYRNNQYSQSIRIIPSSDAYRNKVSLKIIDGVIGYYELGSNTLIEIDGCLNVKKSINDFINYLPELNIKNGIITIRANYNDELLIKIESEDKLNIKDLSKYLVVGIKQNEQIIYGVDHFMENINGIFYNVSIDSFFQVNNEINGKLQDLIKDHINENDIIIDLYCGVGSLSIPLASKAKKIYGVDNNPSNIKDALLNQKINNISNMLFILNDASKAIKDINDKINILIVDPPRSGLNTEGIKNINSILPEKIFYVSCDPVTLARDIKLLSNYQIQDVVLFDMFPYTYHVESLTILNLKNN